MATRIRCRGVPQREQLGLAEQSWSLAPALVLCILSRAGMDTRTLGRGWS